jgi:hypothetical protein
MVLQILIKNHVPDRHLVNTLFIKETIGHFNMDQMTNVTVVLTKCLSEKWFLTLRRGTK